MKTINRLFLLIILNTVFCFNIYAIDSYFIKNNKNQCLTVVNSKYSNGQRPKMMPCKGTENQLFYYQNKQIKPKHAVSKCLDVAGGWGDVLLWSCHNGSNQQFSFYANQMRRSAYSYLCIQDVGNKIRQSYCVNTHNRTFNAHKYTAPVPPKPISPPTPIPVKPITPVKLSSTFIMMSDTQYPCVYNCRNTSLQASEKNLINTFKHISSQYPNAKAVMINGDLTEYGWEYEVSKMKSLFKSYLKLPYLFGLGNHDYLNNLHDCVGNNCLIRTILWLYDDVKSKSNIVSFDATKTQSGNKITMKGSLGFVAAYDDIWLIQLNDNYSGYQYNGFKGGYRIHNYVWRYGNFDHGKYAFDIGGKTYDIDVRNNLSWLEKNLKLAQEQHKLVIVNKHRPEMTSQLENLLNKYNVKLKFAGHYHYHLGQWKNWTLSGAAAKTNYLETVISSDRKMATIKGYQLTNMLFEKNISL